MEQTTSEVHVIQVALTSDDAFVVLAALGIARRVCETIKPALLKELCGPQCNAAMQVFVEHGFPRDQPIDDAVYFRLVSRIGHMAVAAFPDDPMMSAVEEHLAPLGGSAQTGGSGNPSTDHTP